MRVASSTRQPPPVSPRILRRRLAVVMVLALAIVALHHSRLSEWLQDVHQLQMTVDALGPVALVIAASLSTVWVAIGLPRMPASGLAGFLFGAPLGFGVAHVGVVLGNALMYAFMCRFGSGWRLWRRMERRAEQMKLMQSRNGWLDVLMIRLLPVTAIVQNMPLAALKPSSGAFWIGTLFGSLPGTLVAVAIGAGIAEDSMRDAVMLATLAVVLLVASSWMIRRWVKRRESA